MRALRKAMIEGRDVIFTIPHAGYRHIGSLVGNPAPEELAEQFNIVDAMRDVLRGHSLRTDDSYRKLYTTFAVKAVQAHKGIYLQVPDVKRSRNTLGYILFHDFETDRVNYGGRLPGDVQWYGINATSSSFVFKDLMRKKELLSGNQLKALIDEDYLALRFMALLQDSRLWVRSRAKFSSLIRGDEKVLVTVVAVLSKLGAITVRDRNLVLTDRGLRLLRVFEEEFGETIQPRSSVLKARPSLRAHAALNTALERLEMGSLEQLHEHATEEPDVKPETLESAQPVDADQEDMNNDVNYRAYLREADELKKSCGGNCVVAYSDGKLIAKGESVEDLEAKIPSVYWNRPILIKDIPEKTIKVRKRVRVVA
jgi:hypothetical protein